MIMTMTTNMLLLFNFVNEYSFCCRNLHDESTQTTYLSICPETCELVKNICSEIKAEECPYHTSDCKQEYSCF